MINYLLGAMKYILFGSIPLILFLIVFDIKLRKNKDKVFIYEKIAIATLGYYMILIFSVTVSPVYGWCGKVSLENINLIPGEVVIHGRDNLLNLLGNVVMFMPIGVLIPLISTQYRKAGKTFLVGFGISFCIEFIQLFGGRGTDVDDLILNVIGTMVGFGLIRLYLERNMTLRMKTGVFHGKKRRRDGRIICPLIAFMLVFVMMYGGIERYALIHDDTVEPMNAEVNTTVEDSAYMNPNMDIGNYDNSSNMLNVYMNASNACVIDTSENKILFDKSANDKIAPASTTKLLTALTVLEYCDLEENVTVGREIDHVAQDASVAGLLYGNELTIKQLLEGLLLPSGNDAAYVLATYTGKKIKQDDGLDTDMAISAFVEQMNINAKTMGAKDSDFKRPDGYDCDGQYTTAEDMACIACSFLNSDAENGILKDIASKDSIRECFLDNTDITWKNTNELLDAQSPYYYPNAIGLKTGSSGMAGKCLVSAAKINGKTYIAVVMGDSEEGRYEDTLSIYHTIEEN